MHCHCSQYICTVALFLCDAYIVAGRIVAKPAAVICWRKFRFALNSSSTDVIYTVTMVPSRGECIVYRRILSMPPTSILYAIDVADSCTMNTHTRPQSLSLLLLLCFWWIIIHYESFQSRMRNERCTTRAWNDAGVMWSEKVCRDKWKILKSF